MLTGFQQTLISQRRVNEYGYSPGVLALSNAVVPFHPFVIDLIYFTLFGFFSQGGFFEYLIAQEKMSLAEKNSIASIEALERIGFLFALILLRLNFNYVVLLLSSSCITCCLCFYTLLVQEIGEITLAVINGNTLTFYTIFYFSFYVQVCMMAVVIYDLQSRITRFWVMRGFPPFMRSFMIFSEFFGVAITFMIGIAETLGESYPSAMPNLAAFLISITSVVTFWMVYYSLDQSWAIPDGDFWGYGEQDYEELNSCIISPSLANYYESIGQTGGINHLLIILPFFFVASLVGFDSLTNFRILALTLGSIGVFFILSLTCYLFAFSRVNFFHQVSSTIYSGQSPHIVFRILLDFLSHTLFLVYSAYVFVYYPQIIDIVLGGVSIFFFLFLIYESIYFAYYFNYFPLISLFLQNLSYSFGTYLMCQACGVLGTCMVQHKVYTPVSLITLKRMMSFFFITFTIIFLNYFSMLHGLWSQRLRIQFMMDFLGLCYTYYIFLYLQPSGILPLIPLMVYENFIRGYILTDLNFRPVQYGNRVSTSYLWIYSISFGMFIQVSINPIMKANSDYGVSQFYVLNLPVLYLSTLVIILSFILASISSFEPYINVTSTPEGIAEVNREDVCQEMENWYVYNAWGTSQSLRS